MTKKIFNQGRSDHSSAAEEVAGNEDLLREIFIRLPVRSLIRFKSVSKQWSSLISDPQFAQNHTTRTNPSSLVPSGLFFYNSLTMSQEIESVSLQDAPNRIPRVGVRVPSLSFLDFAAAGAKIKILQSCNGLLLCRFTSQSSVKNYCVCNPTTKNYTILPQPRVIPPEEIVDFSLAFHPSESPHYRVVCVKNLSRSPFSSDRTRKIEIYSSESGMWRTSGCLLEAAWSTGFDRGVYWSGTIHWLGDYFGVQFNMNGENFREMELPPIQHSYYNQPLRYFGECGGHLHLIYVRTPSANRFRVLEWDRETLRWSVKYRVHISRLISAFPEIVVKTSRWVHYSGGVEYVFSILCVFKGEKEEDSVLVLTIPGKVISYNFHHKTTKVLCQLPAQVVDTSLSRYKYISAFHYIESLSPV